MRTQLSGPYPCLRVQESVKDRKLVDEMIVRVEVGNNEGVRETLWVYGG